jgi:2'-5' RNA ligase
MSGNKPAPQRLRHASRLMVYGFWMTRRVLVVFPRIAPCNAWSQVVSFRDRFDPLARRVPPHLTLVHPFLDTLSDRALETHVQAVAGTLNVFPIILERVSLHEGEYLFLNVTRGGDDLVKARNQLYQGSLARHCDRDNTFIPHMTIGRVAPDQVGGALAASSELTSQIDGYAEAISAYRIDADGSRSVLFSTALQ